MSSAALTDVLFDKVDADKAGKVAQADFAPRFAAALPAPAFPGGRRPSRAAGQTQPLWPEFNKMIGGYFKFHWVDPQHINVKIDDPKSPLTAMFHGQDFEINDETYTFAQDSFSRENVHVLTSIDYAKMSDEDKAKEPADRADRPRLRAELYPPRRPGTGLLRGARAQREDLRDQADARARAGRHPVRAGRPQG